MPTRIQQGSSFSQTLFRIIYIHGFNSSADSHKAQLFKTSFSQQQKPTQHQHYDLVIPTLSFDPERAIAELETLINEVEGRITLLVGSSLGGYYATYLAEKYQLKAALINPAVSPHLHLGDEFLGPHTNYYTGEQYELNMKHVDYLSTLDIEVLQYPQNYLLLVQTGDEVLDYQLAVDYYQNAKQVVQVGGSHSFDDFEACFPMIHHFSGL